MIRRIAVGCFVAFASPSTALPPEAPSPPAPPFQGGGITRHTFFKTVLDSPGDVGAHPSLVIGADGLGLIAYSDRTSGGFKVAHCSNTPCTAASLSPVHDSSVPLVYNATVAIGGDDLGAIAYHDASGGTVKVAHCATVTCGTLSTPPRAVASGSCHPGGMVIGRDGLPLIAFSKNSSALAIYHCSDAECSSGTESVIDPEGLGRGATITIAGDGLGLIAYYYQNGEGVVRTAHCSDVACSSAVIAEHGTGQYTAITTGTDGLGLFVHPDVINDRLLVNHCNDALCSSVTTTVVDSGVTSRSASITTGSDGMGIIAYTRNNDLALRVAHCANVACTATTSVPVEEAVPVSDALSIGTGTDTFPLIAYYDETTRDLRTIHCSSVHCVPFYRNR